MQHLLDLELAGFRGVGDIRGCRHLPLAQSRLVPGFLLVCSPDRICRASPDQFCQGGTQPSVRAGSFQGLCLAFGGVSSA
ncbi:hypothetical protein QC764_0023730 [Podospora pseudoanserina]|uniref:Uncharacterized protein n=1 Tax=Podospora pseudoanserina TaxID=2609844 RepID=A0ABR0ISN1_9PEZI|nr:hypothetical protein QC764_0023730 [Podospora pseudoanserina]